MARKEVKTMQYLLLLGTIFTMTAENALRKEYDLKAKTPNVFLFTGVSALSAMVFFLARAGFRLEYAPGLWPYAAALAVTYAGSHIGGFLSVRYGSLAISAMMGSFSLVIPALYGVIALGETLRFTGILGIVCLCVSLLLVHWPSEKVHLTIKAVCSMLLLFFANGIFGTVQKLQQLHFNGGYISEVMVMTLAVSAVLLGVFALLQWKKGETKLRPAVMFGIPNGVANGLSNLLVMLMTTMIPNTVLYPSVSAGGIVMGCLAGVVLYRERPVLRQIIGYVFGAAAAVLLNL